MGQTYRAMGRIAAPAGKIQPRRSFTAEDSGLTQAEIDDLVKQGMAEEVAEEARPAGDLDDPRRGDFENLMAIGGMLDEVPDISKVGTLTGRVSQALDELLNLRTELATANSVIADLQGKLTAAEPPEAEPAPKAEPAPDTKPKAKVKPPPKE